MLDTKCIQNIGDVGQPNILVSLPWSLVDCFPDNGQLKQCLIKLSQSFGNLTEYLAEAEWRFSTFSAADLGWGNACHSNRTLLAVHFRNQSS